MPKKARPQMTQEEYMRFLRVIGKTILWMLLCFAHIFFTIVFFPAIKQYVTPEVGGMVVLIAIIMNPVYLSIVSYFFINKISAIFMYLAVILPQIMLCIPYLARKNDEWIDIAKFELAFAIYQIIGITICFGIACLIKYLVHRRKAKKALYAVSEGEVK